MTDESSTRDMRRDAAELSAPSQELSTADLADAANRSAGGSTAELDRKIDDREVERAHATKHADVGMMHETPILAGDVVSELRTRWTDIQAGFVDEPRRAVEQADALVAEAIKRLAETFANERNQLEGQWDRGGDVSTEDLRQALQRYRSFFSRLLSV
ncbi:MAG TPA: hypothetical protein VF461_16900 [Gemmatimonadaceae bacterium]